MDPTTHNLKGRVAIVTGAGRGIGRATARRLGAAGAHVVLASRTVDQLEETRRLIEHDGGRAVAIPTDVTNAAAVEALIDETIQRFTRIDVLVNNAGVARLSPFEQMETEDFDQLVAGNIRSVFACCLAVWPHLKSAGGGVIVNISSVAAVDPFPGFAVYGGTKAFVNTFTKALAAEGAPVGIRVYAVAPGAVDTEMLRGPFPDYPAERTLDPDEVAAVVEMLLSPAAHPMSGQTITVKKEA